MTNRLRCTPGACVAVLLTALTFMLAVGIGGRAPAPVFHLARANAVSNTISDSPQGWSSGNWSGYAVTGGAYTQVSASWTVPTPGATPTPTFSAIWIGVDGFSNSSLIQVGTEHDYDNGAEYYAWWEVLPNPEVKVGGFAVNGGDRVTATVARGDGSSWTISLTNQTTGKSFSTSQSYNGPLASAEWIMESPNVGGQATRLANYGQVSFSSVTANGAGPSLSRSQGGVMVQDGQQVSTPSNPGLSGASFTMGYGAAQPMAPFV